MINFVIIACPETCPANESCFCQLPDCLPSCNRSRYPCDPETPYCVNKCYCNPGFLRESDGTCVRKCARRYDDDQQWQ